MKTCKKTTTTLRYVIIHGIVHATYTCFLLFIPSVLHAQAEQQQQNLQAKLDALFKQSSVPGVSATVAFPDGKVITLVSGFADKENNKRMTSDTLMIQGSVGKTYVAAIAMQLIHDKKLTWTTKVSTYLGKEPWFDKLPNAADVTVKMLMNHTSGIMRYELDPKFTTDLTKQPTKSWQPARTASVCAGQEASLRRGQRLGLQRHQLHRARHDHREDHRPDVSRTSSRPDCSNHWA